MESLLIEALKNDSSINFAIQVNTQKQRCYVFDRDSEVFKTYPVSTSPITSNLRNSYGTPCGLHSITECIGKEADLGMSFKGRKPTEKIIDIYQQQPIPEPEGDFILTRILRLKGLEKGINIGSNGENDYNGHPTDNNVDSYIRCVYFHGTNQEYKLGTKASHGCIRMNNEDIVELFSFIQEGTPVYIKHSDSAKTE